MDEGCKAVTVQINLCELPISLALGKLFCKDEGLPLFLEALYLHVSPSRQLDINLLAKLGGGSF